MKLPEIKKIAQQMGITASGPKASMIKSIQRKEGNFDCFGTSTNGYCSQDNCMWKIDCLKPSKGA